MDSNFHEGWPVGDGEGRNKEKHVWHMENRSKMEKKTVYFLDKVNVSIKIESIVL
jgi:hypothetical protein